MYPVSTVTPMIKLTEAIRRIVIMGPGKISYVHTVWKFHYFSITQILRGINFGDSRSAKSANSTGIKIAKDGTFRTSMFSKIDFT